MNRSRVLARLAAVLSAQVFFGFTPFTTASALQMPEGTWTDVTNPANSFTVQRNPVQTAAQSFSNAAGRAFSTRSRGMCDRDMYLNGAMPQTPPTIISPVDSDYFDDEPFLNTREPGSEVGGIPGRDNWVWPTSSSPYSSGGGYGGGGGGGGASLPEPPGEGFQPMFQHGQFVGWYTPEQVARSATDFAGVLREVVNGPYYYGGASGAASILYEIGDIPSPFAYGFGF